MAKIDQALILKLGRGLQSSPLSPDSDDFNGVKVRFWSTEDLVFMVNLETKKFYGLKFSALALEFFVADDLSLIVLAGNPFSEQEDASYVVEDESFIEQMNLYLSWRFNFLEKLNI